MSTRHTLSVLVENKPGVLTRVAALFARRAFDTHSLAVGETEDPCIPRMTTAVDAAELPIEQVTEQLNRLISVLKIVEPDPAAAVERQLLLVKISTNGSSRINVLQIVDLFHTHVVNVVPDAATVEATGSDTKVGAFLAMLEPYGIREIIQSGAVAITRGARSFSGRVTAELN